MKNSRCFGFLVITLIYICAAAIGIFVFLSLDSLHVFLRLFYADIAATVFVYILGVVLKNASVYDPYWSVTPIIILIGCAIFFSDFSLGVAMLLICVVFWGLRLTYNWGVTFQNLNTQDWRYNMFKAKHPRMFQIISFLGINMFPTIVVYLAVLPAVAFIAHSRVNTLTLLGCLVCLAATSLQLVSDKQMQEFRRHNTDKRQLIRTGMWKYSRHPNYFGEILMWWGVYVVMLSALPHMWYLAIGALINTLMFLLVSIPLADKRYAKEKADFDKYFNETRSLLPIKKRL